MRLIIKYLNLYVLIVINLLASQSLTAQSFEETVDFADYQFKTGNLTTALKTYQRALFFSDGRRTLYLFGQIAEISYLNGDYETAQKYYGLAYSQSDNDSLKSELLFKKASCQILNKSYQLALIDLFSINDTSEITKKRVSFYIGTCFFGLEDFPQAEKYFRSCIDDRDTSALLDLFTRRSLFSPNPGTARILSMILPGSGQTYSGNLLPGLNSLLVTSSLLTLAINIGIRYRPIDAIFSILPFFQRYYTGGYERAGELALRKRQLKRNKVYNEILVMAAGNPENMREK